MSTTTKGLNRRVRLHMLHRTICVMAWTASAQRKQSRARRLYARAEKIDAEIRLVKKY